MDQTNIVALLSKSAPYGGCLAYPSLTGHYLKRHCIFVDCT